MYILNGRKLTSSGNGKYKHWLDSASFDVLCTFHYLQKTTKTSNIDFVKIDKTKLSHHGRPANNTNAFCNTAVLLFAKRRRTFSKQAFREGTIQENLTF